MDRLEAPYINDLETAIERAKQLGRFEIADYLSLKASNDSIRAEAVKWLFDSVLDVVLAFNNHGAKIKFENKSRQSIRYGNSKLTGETLELRQGLRCLTIEAGWTQRSDDGIMRGGALAHSRISHFGYSRKTEELALLKFEEKPQWFSILDEKTRAAFNLASLRKHFEILLND